ncbi:MAG: sigma-70 family RNA polymerase sigma factor, partial [Planctomycetota bacterium]
MAQPSLPFDPDALLEHTRGLRATARALLSDDHQVDDVLQETWLAALRAQPDARRPLGGWLTTVVRNFARMRRRAAGRRRFHERRAARSGTEPSPSEVLERFEIQRLVAQSVAELEEPYRTTILLRYFEDLTPAEIAQRTREPAGTVRSRLKRGRERLRERLDAAHRGDRRACLLSLAAAAGLAEESLALASAATAFATKAIVALAAALIVLAGILVWLTAGDEADPELRERAAARPPPAERAGSSAPTETARGVASPGPDGEEPVPIAGRILAPWGAGLADVDVYVLAPWRGRPADGPTLLGQARTGKDGIFVVPTTATGRLALAAKADGYGWGHQYLRGRRRGIELELHPARKAAGLVVDEEGHPVPGARVRFERIPASEVLTDTNGEFVLEAHRFVYVEAWHPDFMPKRDGLNPGRTRIELGRGDVVEGVVLSHGDRQPVPGATVRVPGNFEYTATTDANGRFRTLVDLRKRGRQYMIRVEAGPLGTLFIPRIPWTPGYALELVLRPTRVLTGHVLTADGRQPLGGVTVSIANTGEEANMLEGPPRIEVVSGGDGSFRFVGVSTRQVQLGVRHPEHALTDGPDAEYVAAGGDAEIEVLVAPRVHLAGRVLGPDGQPLADAVLRVVRAGDLSHLEPSQFRGGPRTDPRGRFRMRWPPRTYYPKLYTECELAVSHRDCKPARSERFEPVPGSYHDLEVRLVASPPSPHITGRVEDPHGAPVPMAHLIAEGPKRSSSTYSA